MKKFTPLILMGLILIGGLIVQTYHWIQSPAVGKNTGQQTKLTSNVLGSEIQLTDLRTSYFATKIPNYLQVRSTNENSNGPVYGGYSLASSRQGQTDQLAVTIGSLGNGSLQETSAAKFRQQDTSEYTVSSRDFAPENALVYTKNSGYETAIFWQHDRRYAAVVISGGGDRKADLEQTLQSVVQNWQWLDQP